MMTHDPMGGTQGWSQSVSELRLKMCRAAVTPLQWLGASLVLAALVGCQEIYTVHLRDYEEWRGLPEGQKALFPDNLPSTAHNIYARHDLDTSATNIAFEIGADSLANLERTLKPAAAENVVWPSMCVNEPWWPKPLNDRAYEEAERMGLVFFTYQERRGKRTLNWGCAVESKTLRVYFWY